MVKEEYYCSQCGRKLDRKYPKMLCDKHYQQLKEYGFFLDDNPRNEDPNEIILYDNHAEIILYNKLTFEPLEETVKISLESVDKVKDYYWTKKQQCVVTKDKGKTIILSNLLMDVETKVQNINGDYLDNRLENLKVVRKNKKKKNQYVVSKKDKNKIIVEIIGKNKSQVTGSSTLISIPLKDGGYKRLLVELGGNQTNKDLYTEYILNKEIVESVPHNEIDYAFILHCHADHIFNMPSLIPNGFKGRVISNEINKSIMLPMCLDGAFIMNKNIRAINNKKHNVEPLFTDGDVYLLYNRTDTYTMNEIHKLDDIVSFQFINAGHILGSCQLILYIKTPTGQIKKIHISSDLGSEYNRQPFVPSKDMVSSSDFSMIEATYNELGRGFKSKKEVEKERNEFKTFLKNELKNKHNVLIGVFAQARQQTMMEFLYRTFKDDKDFNYPIYIDGVLGNNLNNVYLSVLEGEDKAYWQEVMSWGKFHYIGSYEKSMEVALNKEETKLVLSSSGMFQAGRVTNHLKVMIEKKDCTVILCGYQGEGTVGYSLQNPKIREVKIDGMSYNKNCKIYQMSTWSSHIMALENIKYMSQINTPLIVLNHSDEDKKYEFRDIVEEELRKRNNSAKVVCASIENNIFFI